MGTILNAAGSNDRDAFIEGLFSALSDFYIKNPDTNLGKLYQALADLLAGADVEVSALLHDNFISAEVLEESKVRGEEERDRLDSEGVFKITRIGFGPIGTVVRETHFIDTEDTTITLGTVPEDFEDIRIVDGFSNPVTTVIDYSEEENTITVAGVSTPGSYNIRYADKGNVKTETERLTVPAELFEVGWSQGGFGNFGFGL